jgi:hypothetical protein
VRPVNPRNLTNHEILTIQMNLFVGRGHAIPLIRWNHLIRSPRSTRNKWRQTSRRNLTIRSNRVIPDVDRLRLPTSS